MRGLQLTFLEMYAGQSLPRIAEIYPEAFETIAHNGKEVSYLTQIPEKLRPKMPAPLLKILSTQYENVSDLQRAVTESHLSLED